MSNRLTEQNERRRGGSDSDSLSAGIVACTICCGFPLLAILIVTAAFAAAASTGVLAMLIGNSIMRLHYPTTYTSDHTASIIGALGGVLAGTVTGPLVLFTVWFAPAGIIAFGALTGAIGAAILKYSVHRDIGALTLSTATIAGTVGGSVLIVPTLALTVAVAYGMYEGFSWWDRRKEKRRSSMKSTEGAFSLP